jgi:hypothetical protein
VDEWKQDLEFSCVANDAEVVVLQGRQKFNYLFLVFGFVCCFASYCGVALVRWFQ